MRAKNLSKECAPLCAYTCVCVCEKEKERAGAAWGGAAQIFFSFV